MLSVCEGLCALGSRRCGVLSRIEPRVRALLKPQPGSQQPHPRALVSNSIFLSSLWDCLLDVATSRPFRMLEVMETSGMKMKRYAWFGTKREYNRGKLCQRSVTSTSAI